MEYFRITRSQHSRGSSANMFGGPDTYMAVVAVPDDVEFYPERTPLNKRLLESKGIRIYHCGEFYHDHTSERARLYQGCVTQAKTIEDKLIQQQAALWSQLSLPREGRVECD